MKLLKSILLISLTLTMSLSSSLVGASSTADQNANWTRFDAKSMTFIPGGFIPETQSLFTRRNTEGFVPPIQYFNRPIQSDFETDFKRITRDVLAKINDEGKLPSYVKPIKDSSGLISIKGQKVKAHYIEYEYQGKNRTKMACFTAVQTGNSIHTFFTQSKKGTFTDCQKEMRDVVNYI